MSTRTVSHSILPHAGSIARPLCSFHQMPQICLESPRLMRRAFILDRLCAKCASTTTISLMHYRRRGQSSPRISSQAAWPTVRRYHHNTPIAEALAVSSFYMPIIHVYLYWVSEVGIILSAPPHDLYIAGRFGAASGAAGLRYSEMRR